MIDFHPILPALQPHVNTPLPYHLPLHPVTVTTFQPPRSALRCVPLTDSCFTFPSVLPQPEALLVCLYNARSVGTSRRRSDISTFIQDNNIDIMLLTETWLRPAGDEAKIADLAPPRYSVLSFPRSAGGSGAKGGGIAFVLRDSLEPHVATTSSFPVKHPCFETAQLSLTYNKQLTNLFCIHRPPPSEKNKFSDSMFFDQFSDFLEHSDSLPGKTLLMGDFNFHFENVENKDSRKLHDIIDMFNLTQSVSEPTHNQGHLLDIVFSKQSDNIFTSTKLHHGLTSDHTAILCRLDVSVLVQKPETFFVPMPQKD